MLSKGQSHAGLPPEKADQGFYFSLFFVQKKDGGMRPVINLESLNEYVVLHHFKMERIHTLRDLLKRNWMTKVDLKDAYFMTPIHSSNRSVLCFSNHNHCMLPVFMPVLCSLGLYQDPGASSNSAQGDRSKASGIHR